MAVQLPTPEQVRAAASEVGLSLTDADVQSYIGLMKASVDAYNAVDAMPDCLPEVRYPRTPGRFPSAEENTHNAWYVKTSIAGADAGPLKGKKVAIKDNAMVAGVPMMNGNSILEAYVPEIDATVVGRLLDAGAEIVGKTHCESYCLSGSSHTGAKGPVHNPYKMGYSAGGSSSGSGVVVALGEADMALGGDQGGSIRIPSCWCGIYGMKPTHGLVPYTGIMPIEIFLDHTGPMTASVADNALMLEVIAGEDGYDPRQYSPKVAKYAQTMMFGDGYGLSRQDLYVTSLIDKLHGWTLRANELSETAKIWTTFGVYARKYHGSHYYGKAVNVSRRLREAYDTLLRKYDLLMMPTLPMKPQPLPPTDATREEYFQRAIEMIGNTCPFDVTHHPAMSVPCGMIDGLPTALMLIGKHWDESTIYKAAHAFEQSGDWKKM